MPSEQICLTEPVAEHSCAGPLQSGRLAVCRGHWGRPQKLLEALSLHRYDLTIVSATAAVIRLGIVVPKC